MIEFMGINIFQVVSVIVALTITYVIARILTKFLEKLFKKTPFPDNIEKSIAKNVKYVVYFLGILTIVSIMGVDISSIILFLLIIMEIETLNIRQNDPFFKIGALNLDFV